MKKWVYGLVGIALGFSGCALFQPTIDEEAKRFLNYAKESKKVFSMRDINHVAIFPPKFGKNYFNVIVDGKNIIKSKTYIDKDGDGYYEERQIITIPKKLDVLGIIPKQDELKKKIDNPIDKELRRLHRNFNPSAPKKHKPSKKKIYVLNR